MPGLFITFEGTEGGGKSTQIGHLAKRLLALNLTVLQLREPGGTANLVLHSAVAAGLVEKRSKEDAEAVQESFTGHQRFPFSSFR